MTPDERRAVGLLSAMYALRMAGLFLIFPVFSLYAQTLSGYSPTLMGLALGGAYGLAQALLQIPFGIASDRFGRKPVIALGLVLFAVGSVVAAMSSSIWGVIIGRTVQGAGAISAPVMALLADLTREQQRTKAMAMIGITIGASFIVSLIVGPMLANLFGVTGIFWFTAAGAVSALALLLLAVPSPTRSTVPARSGRMAEFARVLRDPQLLRLNVGIFVVHMTIPALFVVLPHILVDYVGLPAVDHWKLYLPVMLLGVVVMAPVLGYTSRRDDLLRLVFIGGIAVLLVAEISLGVSFHSFAWLVVSLALFFAAFNLLEAMLPSTVSRLAPPAAKGTALGVYSTSQFLGVSFGGWMGGFVYHHVGIVGVLVFAALGVAGWLLLAITAPPFKLNSSAAR
ncbi:MAG: MFS transporter [Gammaproteobacteria bacterium]|nr:MFS transporter [Gammaproteobacteria bacterium]